MSTKMGFWRWALASAAVMILCGTASARLVNDPPTASTVDPAAIVILPKVRVDTDICQRDGNSDAVGVCSVTGGLCPFNNSGTPEAHTANDGACDDAGIDTIIQLTNTSEFLTRVKCFYVNANGHCSNDETTICTQENFRETCPIGGRCIDGWIEDDFVLTLTKRQPLSWSANDGLSNLPLQNRPGQGDPPQFNDGSIPPVSENPFRGELRCIQLDVSTELPADRNDLKAEATIITTGFGDAEAIDARKYNAYGLRAIEGAQDEEPTILNIGGPQAEYLGCPNILTLNHFFEGASVSTHQNTVVGPVVSTLTVVPCGADFELQDLNLESAVIQFLIFNEFEQRFSTSTRVTCFKQVRLADIDTRPGLDGNEFSIFSAGVQGTLTGMSRLRSVQGTGDYDANAILAILDESWADGECRDGGAGTGAGGESKRVQANLCFTDADCPEDGVCEEAGAHTTSVTVQGQGSRERGDQMFVPIP